MSSIEVTTTPPPYFDEILNRLNLGDPEVERLWGTNVHFGYWERPHPETKVRSQLASASRKMNEVIFQAAQIKNGQKILDVGCGFGGTLKQLDETYHQLELVGVNIDLRQIERAKKKNLAKSRSPVTFVHADACALPFEDSTFDVVLAVECIFHFRNRQAFLQEAQRILKPGGRIVLTDFTFWAPLIPAIRYILKKNSKFKKLGHFEPTAASYYHHLTAKAHLSHLKITNITANIEPNYKYLFNSTRKAGNDKYLKLNRLLRAVQYQLISAQKIS